MGTGCALIIGGLIYWDGDSDYASLNPAMAAATLLLKYAPMASTSDKQNSYRVSRSGSILKKAEADVRTLRKVRSTTCWARTR